MPVILALLSGIVFGAGLTISDMVNPARVLNFLDLAGNWDPTLLFVMGGGLAVTMAGYRIVFGRARPLADGSFHLPARRQIDSSLVGGATIFGVGWGLAGICPGPALTDLVTLNGRVLGFVAAMLIGALAARSIGWISSRKALPA